MSRSLPTTTSPLTTSTTTSTRAANRCGSLSECDLGVAQRLALMALRHGSFVRDLPEGSFVGDTAEEARAQVRSVCTD